MNPMQSDAVGSGMGTHLETPAERQDAVHEPARAFQVAPRLYWARAGVECMVDAPRGRGQQRGSVDLNRRTGSMVGLPGRRDERPRISASC